MDARKFPLPARGLLSVFVALVVASGCGGVDSGGTGAVAVGPISGFGSIIVNGVRFDESRAVIRDDDGTPFARERLALGVVTEVEASAPTLVAGRLHAFADSIRVSSDLIGPVTAVDVAGGTVTVLGQTVVVTPATAFDANLSGGLGNVTIGITVEIHGRLDIAKARYTATRIEARPNPPYYKLRGVIAAVDPPRGTLTIGGQTIDTARIPPSDMPNVVVGNLVRAKLEATTPAGAWIAIGLPPGVAPLPDREVVTLEGRITAWTSSRSFSVGGIAVDAGSAVFPDGEAGVVLGARVEVKGSSRAGVVHANTVEFEGDEDAANSIFELHGTIESIDLVARTFSLRGITVDYGGSVQYDGGSAADLAVGRAVDVHGVLASDGMSIEAQKIEFERD